MSMLKSKFLFFLSVMLLVACGSEKSQAQLDNKNNCIFDAIHPSNISKSQTLFFDESSNASRWNSRLIYKDYYVNIDSNICNLISLNLVLHRYNDFIDMTILEKFEKSLNEIRKASPFFEGLPNLSEADKINLLNTNKYEKEGLRLSIVETDSNSILVASWTSSVS